MLRLRQRRKPALGREFREVVSPGMEGAGLVRPVCGVSVRACCQNVESCVSGDGDLAVGVPEDVWAAAGCGVLGDDVRWRE